MHVQHYIIIWYLNGIYQNNFVKISLYIPQHTIAAIYFKSCANHGHFPVGLTHIKFDKILFKRKE